MGTVRIRQDRLQTVWPNIGALKGTHKWLVWIGMAGIPPSYHPVVGIKTCTQGVFCFFEKKTYPTCGRSLMDVGMYEYWVAPNQGTYFHLLPKQLNLSAAFGSLVVSWRRNSQAAMNSNVCTTPGEAIGLSPGLPLWKHYPISQFSRITLIQYIMQLSMVAVNFIAPNLGRCPLQLWNASPFFGGRRCRAAVALWPARHPLCREWSAHLPGSVSENGRWYEMIWDDIHFWSLLGFYRYPIFRSHIYIYMSHILQEFRSKLRQWHQWNL